MMNTILIVILGCNINYLLEDRLDTAINFANNYAFTNTNIFSPNYNSIHWALSGEIKNPEINTESDAEKMASYILYREKALSNWEYYIDEVSRNTAENFVMIKKHIRKSGIKYSNIYIVTSEFHYNRAKILADVIIPNNNFNWILGTKKNTDSEYLELIYMKNIMDDIYKLYKKFKYV